MLHAKKLVGGVVGLALVLSAVIYAYEPDTEEAEGPTVYDFLTEEQCQACRIDSLTPIQRARVLQGLLDDCPMSFTEQTAEAYMARDRYHKFILAAIIPHEWSPHRHYAIVIHRDNILCLESPLLTDPLVPGVYWTDYDDMGIFFDILYPDGREQMFSIRN